MEADTRKPAIAGTWYPGSPDVLDKDIKRYIDNADVPPIPKKPAVIISPHAGYIYSGPVAGYSYKAVTGHDYSSVVVISPSHKAFFPFVSVWAKGVFETPLGDIPVDSELCSALIGASRYIRDERSPHVAEHALEIQLPFIQHTLKKFRLCPLIMGEQNLIMCRELADKLAKCIKNPDETLVVASSDLSHFHHAERAKVMDGNVSKLIGKFDIEGLSEAVDSGKSEACGAGPMMAAMLYAKSIGRKDVKVLKYANSGDITGDRSSVVGYLSAVIY
jgi:AmmeMemoRadiSam system protein B